MTEQSSQAAMLQEWQNLRTRAESGELRMSADISSKLVGRCETFIGQLQDMLRKTDSLEFVDGFGTLKSATALRNKFAGKAAAAPDSAANRLKLAIDIVTLMKQTFELSAKAIEETDTSTSQALGNAGV